MTYCKVLNICGQRHYIVIAVRSCATVARFLKPDKFWKTKRVLADDDDVLSSSHRYFLPSLISYIGIVNYWLVTDSFILRFLNSSKFEKVKIPFGIKKNLFDVTNLKKVVSTSYQLGKLIIWSCTSYHLGEVLIRNFCLQKKKIEIRPKQRMTQTKALLLCMYAQF
jgi:hypothetical protein